MRYPRARSICSARSREYSGIVVFVSGKRLDPHEQVGEALPQPFSNLLDVHQGYVPDAAFDPAVVRPVQPAPLSGLFLIDPLLLAYATDGTAKSDADVEGHHPASWRSPADAYTSDESHCY